MANKKMLESPKDLFDDLDEGLQNQLEFDNILVDIASKFINYRVDHHITQRQLAQKLEVSQVMVSKLESGDYNPSVEHLFKLSKKLGWGLTISLCDLQERDLFEYIGNAIGSDITKDKIKSLGMAS